MGICEKVLVVGEVIISCGQIVARKQVHLQSFSLKGNSVPPK